MRIVELFDVDRASIYSSFHKLLRDSGHEFIRVDWDAHPMGEPRLRYARELIGGAGGIWVSDHNVMANQAIATAVERRLAAGGHLFFSDCEVALLQDRGVETLNLSVRNLDAFGDEHLGVVELDRERHEGAFRDSQLFRRVNRLAIQQPRALMIRGAAAQRVLAVPVPPFTVLERDLVVQLPKPEVCPMAILQPEDWQGAALVVSGDALHDPYDSWLDSSKRFPGITAADNEQFAKNVIAWLGCGGAPPTENWEDAFRLIVQVEYLLIEITRTLLGDGWFEFVREETQAACVQRATEEGTGLTPAAYLNLTDYEKVWRKQWERGFAAGCTRGGLGGTKGSLDFFAGLNSLRKFAMHPTKAALGGRTKPTDKDLQFLKNTLARLRKGFG